MANSYWSRGTEKRGKGSFMVRKKVVCMGDSITEGFGIENPDKVYPSRLQQILGNEYLVVNKGHCGCCVTNEVLDGNTIGYPYVSVPEYRQALEEKGDIYMILLGTNDAQDGMDDVEDIQDPLHNIIKYKDNFEASFQKIIDDVYESNPDAKIFVGTPAPVMQCIWRKHQEKYLEELLPYYRTLSKNNPAITLVNVHSVFMAIAPTERKELYQDDKLHPNEAGAELIALAVGAAILED